MGITDFVWEKLKNKPPTSLPSLLQQRIFIDPQNSLQGYSISSAGEVELRIRYNETEEGKQIVGVTDLRGQESEEMQVVALSEISHVSLRHLEQIEDPNHILVWSEAEGGITRIELPRYGLQFAFEGEDLICTTPSLAGYRVLLNASQAERKGLAFSLLLEHPDRTQPKKLLLPPANAITSGVVPMPSYSGLAFVLWILKVIILYLTTGELPNQSAVPVLKVQSNSDRLTLNMITMRPHTEEFMYTPGQETEEAQQLILQILQLGEREQAIEIFHSLEIPREYKTLHKWMRFLDHPTWSKNGAVALRISNQLLDMVKGDKRYEKFSEDLILKEKRFFRDYLSKMHSDPRHLQIPQEMFVRIAQKMKISSFDYYNEQIFPYFFTKEILEQALPVRGNAILEKEDALQPTRSIDRNSLRRDLPLLEHSIPLVWVKNQLSGYFSEEEGILTDSRGLFQQEIEPKLQEIGEEKSRIAEELHTMLFTSSDAIEQLAIYSKEKNIASKTELLVALLQDDFASLEAAGRLPKGIDLNKLKETVICFYDLEVKHHLVAKSEDELSQMMQDQNSVSPEIWCSKSLALLEALTYKREYDTEQLPELLAFEALHYITFRNGSAPSQLQLLKEILESVSSIVQAGTGTGKSSLLSVLRALMRANGTNLVTQKVLPHLYRETLGILQTRLGNLQGKLYPLLFNQSMPLQDAEGNSLFAQIYSDLLSTIQNKGCVLTDYKSIPLFEQKFFSCMSQIASYQREGHVVPQILITHCFYLKKILVLLQNREDSLMDEFDQPLRAVQRIQTQMKEGPLFERWMIEASLELYDILLEDPELLLAENLQKELPADVRLASIVRAAKRLAENFQKPQQTETIYGYLIGENEDILSQTAAWGALEQDRLAFFKDQCSTFLPLTLSRSSHSNYARGKDGKKVITCVNGGKRDAKFGNPIEEINYTIQDYFQKKMTPIHFREWLLDAKKDWLAHPEDAERRFAEILPDVSLGNLVYLSPDDFEDQASELLEQVNRNPQTIRFFLEQQLCSLRASGRVVSMNPQDMVEMSLAVTGISATTGSLHSLHEQFDLNDQSAQELEKVAIARLKRRSLREPIYYKLGNPLEAVGRVEDPHLCAIIDGSGILCNFPNRTVAEALLDANPILEKVEYYDEEGHINFIGQANAPLEKKGFYFPQEQNRGADKKLHPHGVALLTATEEGSIEDFIQEEGRMRHEQQKICVMLPDHSSIRTLDALIECKKENKKAGDAEDRYHAEAQRLHHIMRAAGRKEILEIGVSQSRIEELQPCIDRFVDLEMLFIQTLASEDIERGDYFQKNQKLIDSTGDPVNELTNLKIRLTQESENLNLSHEALEAYEAESIRPYLPSRVTPLSALENQEQEVQEELELNTNFEVEQEQQQESETVEKKWTFIYLVVQTRANIFKQKIGFIAHFLLKLHVRMLFCH